MNPISQTPQTGHLQYVPSLVVPSRTLAVQHLYAPRQPLSVQDLYVLQRTAIPAGQQWLYLLQSPDQSMQVAQISLSITPGPMPSRCLDEETWDLSGQKVPEAQASGYDADTEGQGAAFAGVASGP